ncbi:MAG: HD-GYP domain-containing protein [Gammaproteobacteria bacterium]
MPVTKISTVELEVGMFVSSLDRPWSETPFLFQGFPVREEAEIEELKNLCRYVYIMVPDEEIELSRLSSRRKPEEVYSDLIGRKRYEITKSAREELRVVRSSHEQISHLMLEIEDTLREDKELDVQTITNSIEFMVDSIERNPDAYIWLTRIKKFDSHIYKDSLSASVWATTLGRELGLERDKLNALAMGALFMDIGKTSLPAALLNKTDRLTDDEWALMKSHVEHGVRILSENNETPADVLDIVRTHHERLDGSGYPSALRGNEIPFVGQIAGIIDFYVSVTSPRPYARAVSPSNATYMLYQQQGRYFSDLLVRSLIQALSTYPTGSLIELSSGEVGVVVSQNPGLRLKPNVVLLLDPDKSPYGSYPLISLVDYTQEHAGNPVNIKKALADGEYGIRIEELAF